jgi:glucose dehydrogenase
MDPKQVLRSVLLLFVFVVSVPRAQEVAWVANGRDLEGTRYLPASEITRDNVGRLEVAWTYRTGEADERSRRRNPRHSRRHLL